MSGKEIPSLRLEVPENVLRCNLSQKDKDYIRAVFALAKRLKVENEILLERLITYRDHCYRDEKFV